MRAAWRVLIVVIVITQTTYAQSVTGARDAVTRALPLLQRSAGTFVAERACVSCHHNSLAILTLHLARERGVEIDATTLDAIETKTFRELRHTNALDDAIQSATVADPTPNDSYLLLAAHAAGVEPDLTTAVYARRIARWQRDGHWITSDFRPPHSSSLFAATATAVRSLQFYMPEELATEREAAMNRARQWLFATRPHSTEDAAFRLMGLAWSRATSAELAAAGRDLRALQQPGGGWPQLPRYESDAYSTGEALFALREAGVPASDAAWRRGLAFLLSTQARDGTWRVHTRMISPADVSPPYFSTGFPYEQDEFLSYAGSCWAVMAILSSLPETNVPRTTSPDRSSRDVASWVRPALFGTARELGALLDSGLDPNSRTDNGTTVLMMAAPDADKVRLLVSRGADVKARAGSGSDALTIASAHHASTASLRALLDGGAPPQAPAGVRQRRSPLVFAAMTGNLENVRLLLAHGARSSEEALAEAVTFGHASVAKALIDAGANAQITEGSGINLLHWAAITNRASVIPILAKAGVPLDAIDDAGFTPLMYAATLDVGDTDTLRALLTAGADRRIRNEEGRTPLEQARHYGHMHLVDALK